MATERAGEDALIASVANQLPVGVWVARAPRGDFIYANETFAEIMGMKARSDVELGSYSEPYRIHTRSGELYPEDQLPFARALREQKPVLVDDITIHRHDGRHVHIRAQARPVFAGDGSISHVIIAFIDITREVEAERARVESEARLRRAQRMETVGKLAGGIAHDFNNLLATIRAIATTRLRTTTDAGLRDDLRLIDEVVESGAKLTQALLGFAGRGHAEATRLSLNDLVRSMSGMLERLLDRRITVELGLEATRDEISGERGQLEQLLMNLVVNARDAMPDGGRLVLATRDHAGPAPATPHVVLEVADTGVGIDPSIRERIFEPYFTTKTSGSVRGTGLGLAIVYGIVDAHGGSIEVAPNAPRGTVVRVLLPSVGGRRVEPRSDPREPALARGRGRVLLVEDEPQVRAAVARALAEIGYEVVAARDGVEALEIYRARHAEIAAVILDMIMPRLSGKETYLALRQVNPEVPVVLTTGYSDEDEVRSIIDLGVRAFLSKPYAIEALSQALAQAITPRP